MLFQPLPSSAWANGKLAEEAEKVGKMVEHPKSKSSQPWGPILVEKFCPLKSPLKSPLTSQVRLEMPNPVE